MKAGLRGDAWKAGARILRFQAEVFSESSERASVSAQEHRGDESGRAPRS
jgi:AMMECR1 domain-containing protein